MSNSKGIRWEYDGYRDDDMQAIVDASVRRHANDPKPKPIPEETEEFYIEMDRRRRKAFLLRTMNAR